jgi:hypothetical protein
MQKLSQYAEATLGSGDMYPLAVCCLLSAVCCLLSVVCCLLSAVCCLLSVVCCLLFAVCCLLSAVCCLLSAVRCLLSEVATLGSGDMFSSCPRHIISVFFLICLFSSLTSQVLLRLYSVPPVLSLLFSAFSSLL